MAEHPYRLAVSWLKAFSEKPLRDTAYAKQLSTPLETLVSLHTDPMPWRVRLSVLFTGRIPYSYLENFDDD